MELYKCLLVLNKKQIKYSKLGNKIHLASFIKVKSILEVNHVAKAQRLTLNRISASETFSMESATGSTFTFIDKVKLKARV
jgi:hypothetical protein